MKIAICDDSIEDLFKIEQLLLKYKTLYPGRDFELEKFSDPAVLSQLIAQGRLADIYILDMLMQGKTGIAIGSQLRQMGCENAVIYVTASDDFALDAYGVRALRYILKPVSESRLFEALDYALSTAMLKSEPLFLIKTEDGLVQTPYSGIEYIENVRRKLEVHLTDGRMLKSLFIRKSFEDEICELVLKKNFQQVHKSFLVNLDYVRRLTAECINMESGKLIPVSKARAARVRREYLLYVSDKYR